MRPDDLARRRCGASSGTWTSRRWRWASIPQWHVMSLARDGGVKVVLDGQGGDEIFAGYTNYAPQHLYGLLGAQPTALPVRSRWRLGVNQGWAAARTAARSAVAMRCGRQCLRNRRDKPDAALLAPELRELADVSHDEWRLWPRVFDGWLTNVLYWELTRTRLPALLRYEDRLSMAFSIESRVPFLDHRLVELAFALPDQVKRSRRLVEVRPAAGARRVAASGRRLAPRQEGLPHAGRQLAARRARRRGASTCCAIRRGAAESCFPQAAVDGFVRDHVRAAWRIAPGSCGERSAPSCGWMRSSSLRLEGAQRSRITRWRPRTARA